MFFTWHIPLFLVCGIIYPTVQSCSHIFALVLHNFWREEVDACSTRQSSKLRPKIHFQMPAVFPTMPVQKYNTDICNCKLQAASRLFSRCQKMRKQTAGRLFLTQEVSVLSPHHQSWWQYNYTELTGSLTTEENPPHCKIIVFSCHTEISCFFTFPSHENTSLWIGIPSKNKHPGCGKVCQQWLRLGL